MKLFCIALRHARRLSTAASTAAVKPPSMTQSLSKLRKVTDPDEALQIYNTFIAGNSAPSARFAQLLTVRLLAKSGRFSDIETFLESHKSSPHTTEEYFLYGLIQSYSEVGMFENALRTYEQMSDLGTPCSSLSFNALLMTCVKSKMFASVITYFDELPVKFGFSPNKKSYGILIKAYCEVGSPEIAIEKLKEMQSKGFEIDVVVFTTIYHSLSVKGRIQEAERFWDVMVKEEGVKPDTFGHNVKLGNIQHGDMVGFKRLIEEMNNAGIVYDGITYSVIIRFYCENGMTKEATKAYGRMLVEQGCKWVHESFRTLVFHYYKIGQFMSASKVFKESLYYMKILDFEALKFLAEGLVKTGHEKEAQNLIFRSMKKKRLPPNVLEACVQLADALGLVCDGNEDLDLDKIENGVDTKETVKPSESPTSSQTMKKLIKVFSSNKQKVPYQKTKASRRNSHSGSL